MVAAIKDNPKEEKKFIEIIEQDTIEKKPPVEKNVAGILLRENRDGKTVDIVRSEDKPAVKPLTQNKCSSIATDNDFLKLRKKMAAETDDDDMVDEARKYFRNVCFTTVQMKNLAALFLDDLGKYKFFDVAYLFVSDIENFPNLQSELKNEYYINRFKAMLK